MPISVHISATQCTQSLRQNNFSKFCFSMFSTKIPNSKVVSKRWLIYMSSRHRALTFILDQAVASDGALDDSGTRRDGLCVYVTDAWCSRADRVDGLCFSCPAFDRNLPTISSSSTYLLLAEPFCQHLFWRLGFSWRESIFLAAKCSTMLWCRACGVQWTLHF